MCSNLPQNKMTGGSSGHLSTEYVAGFAGKRTGMFNQPSLIKPGKCMWCQAFSYKCVLLKVSFMFAE